MGENMCYFNIYRWYRIVEQQIAIIVSRVRTRAFIPFYRLLGVKLACDEAAMVISDKTGAS